MRPIDGQPVTQRQLENLARATRAQTAELGADGTARLGFSAARYSAETARSNLEMAVRMELGAHWQTRYRIAGG